MSRKQTAFNRSAHCLNSHRARSTVSIRSQLAETKEEEGKKKAKVKSKSGCEMLIKTENNQSNLYMAVNSKYTEIEHSRKQMHMCNTSDAFHQVPDFPQTFFKLSHGLSVSDSPGKNRASFI